MPDWYTHLGIGAGLGTVIWLGSTQLGYTEPIALPVAAVSALMPDIDIPGSYISRRVIPIPQNRGQRWPGVKHRGAWHYQVSALAAALIVGIVTYRLIGLDRFAQVAALATFVGWSSHVVADKLGTRMKRRRGPR